MAFDLGAVLRSAAVRTLRTSGLLFVGALFALGTVNTAVASSIDVPSPGPVASPTYQLPFEVPLSVAGAVTILVGLLTLYVTMVAIRTFARKETGSIPSVVFTRNALPAYANFVVGGFVFATAVFVGMLLFLLPGLFVFATLGFWAVYVAVEDEDFVTGLQDSWLLTDGHRLQLFALVLSLIVITVGVNAVFGVADVAVGGAVGMLVSQVGTALSSVFSLATLTEAYVQLSALQSAATASSL
jgi:hypothetical protein